MRMFVWRGGWKHVGTDGPVGTMGLISIEAALQSHFSLQ